MTVAGELTWLDRLLQRWRITQALAHVRSGSRVCDIGTYDGTLFKLAGARISSGVGIDPELVVDETRVGAIQLRRGLFPADLPSHEPFDAITALAVLEHIPREGLVRLADDVAAHLAPGGRFIVTCPTPAVDRVLDVLTTLHLVKGQSLEQHYGLHPDELLPIFGQTLTLTVNQPFQLGLNRLLVFEKEPA
jgi:2-polyprenyl-3-methyl-5-hydroxy-6-metoxy-1,4-benzoquinol methylase